MPTSEYEKYSWLKWVVCIFIFVILVGVVIYFVWFRCHSHKRDHDNCCDQYPNCGCGKQKKKQKKQKCCKDPCPTEGSYVQLNSTGVIPIDSGDQEFLILAQTFNDPALVKEPCDQWEPVNSTDPNFLTAVTGIQASCDGDYYIEYHAGMVSQGAVTLITVNGLLSLRSVQFTMDLQEEPQICGRSLAKSFNIHLHKGDVVGLLIIPFILDGFFIDEYPDASPLRYLTTLLIQLVKTDKCKHNKCGECLNETDLVPIPIGFVQSTTQSDSLTFAPDNTGNGTGSLPIDNVFLQRIAALKAQIISQDLSNPNPAAIMQALAATA